MIDVGSTDTDEHRSEHVASNDSTGPDDEAVDGSSSPRRSKSSGAKTAKPESGKTPDPEVLAGEIEKTREELAETLDAIAERVSPKRVADRTKKKVGGAVKEGTHDAVESVKGGVAAVKYKVGSVEVPPASAATTGALADAAVTPVEPVGAEAPIYTELPPAAPSRLPLIAGAGATLLVVLFLLRRRRR